MRAHILLVPSVDCIILVEAAIVPQRGNQLFLGHDVGRYPVQGLQQAKLEIAQRLLQLMTVDPHMLALVQIEPLLRRAVGRFPIVAHTKLLPSWDLHVWSE